MTELTAERARKLWSYDPTTGELRWLVHGSSHAPRGSRAGGVSQAGYRMIRFEGRSYRASRIIWLMQTGEWPEHYVDHKNRDRADDRWENLREASPRQNQHNRPARFGGLKGVTKHWGNRFRARIFVAGENIELGLFDTDEAAARAYDAAALRHFGEFAYQNFPSEVPA